jgi:hypothetical protein
MWTAGNCLGISSCALSALLIMLRMSFIEYLSVMHTIQCQSSFGICLTTLEIGRALEIQCAMTSAAWRDSCSKDKAALLLQCCLLVRREPELLQGVLPAAADFELFKVG